MKRFHLFEFEDFDWFPTSLRNYLTDYLQFVSNLFDFYAPIVPILVKGLNASHGTTMIDLGSGGGGGLVRVANQLATKVTGLQIVLTDLHPNLAAFEATVAKNPQVFSYRPEKIDALNVPPALTGFRTQFLSFHHFQPHAAQQILQNAVDAGAAIAIFEGQKRDLSHLLRFALSPIFVLLFTPFIKPLTLGRLVFTYLIPVVPLVVMWDGVVSVLRTYTAAELQNMTAALRDGDLYRWEIGEAKNGQVTIPYLLGYSKSSR